MQISEKDFINDLAVLTTKVAQTYGQDTANSVFDRYDATSPYDLQSCYLQDALLDLEMMANDI